MAYRIQIREAESATDKTWHDVTEYILSTGFSVRSGFATLGSNADLGKLSLSYRTYDLATASMFGSTIKLIRVIEDDHIVFEGYSDSASTVDSTENAGLAWVKLTAYPYIKALEDVELSSDWVAYDMTVKDIAEQLWSKALAESKDWVKEAIEESVTITFPEISKTIPLVKVSKGDKPMDTLVSMMAEFCYSIVSSCDNLVKFIQPYSADSLKYASIPFESIYTKPTIKTSPYVKTKAPQVTLSKIVVKEDIEVYSLTGEDGKNAEQELYKDGSEGYSPYYPEDGDAEVSYSNSDIENDMVSFLWAKDLSIKVESRRSDNSADGDIIFTRSELLGDKAYYRVKNISTTISCYLNQLRIIAGTAYFTDKSYVVRSEGEGEKTEVETHWIQTGDDATAYAKALADESRCATSSLVFKSDTLEGMAPGMLVKIGNIPAVFIIKSIEKNLDKNETTFSCLVYDIKEISTDTFYRPPSTLRGPKGEDAPTMYYVWSMSPEELIVPSKAVWSVGEKWMLFNGFLMGDFGIQDWESSWDKLMESRTEEYDYLWAKVGEDGEPFRLQGVSPMDFSFVVSPSNYVVNPRNLSDITLTITLSRQNGIKGASTLVFNGTYTGISMTQAEDDVWTVKVEQKSTTALSFKVTATIGGISKVLEVTGQLVGNEAKCIGWVSELPQYTQEGFKLIEGDTCILDGTPMMFNGSSWDTINDISSLPYEMGVAIGNTALFSGNDVTQSMVVLWAFIQNLYAQSALIEHLRTSNITMEGNGIIRSKDVLDSHIGDKQLPVTGYALDGQNGRLQSNKAFIANANVVNATINTATLSAIRSDNFNFGRRSSLTVGYGFSWTYGSYVGPFTFFKQIVSVMSQGVMTPSYFSGSATVNGSSVSNGYVFYDIESMCLYFSTQESTSNPQIKMRFNESDSKVYVSINSGSESQLSSATINVSVTCPEGLPTCISLYPWNNDSSNIGVYKSSIGSPRVPFDSIFGKIGLFDDIRIGYLDSISDGSYYLDGTGEWSIKLPGKKIMKWKYLYRTGNDSAEWRTWTFATQFPTGCDFAFAVPVKSDQNRDAYYYGYMGALSSTYVNFSTWGLFDYFCIAIGS